MADTPLRSLVSEGRSYSAPSAARSTPPQWAVAMRSSSTDNVDRLAGTVVISPTPLGIRAPGVEEERLA